MSSSDGPVPGRVVITADNYPLWMGIYEGLGELMVMMEEIRSQSPIGSPQEIEVLNQVYMLIAGYYNTLKATFDAIEERETGQTHVFHKVSQQELWRRRNKAYKYRV